MGKYSPSKLLALAELFETKAKCLVSDRFWALTVIAQTSDETNIPGITLRHQIKSLTHTSPTNEDWSNWLNANSTVIGRMAWGSWSFNDQRSSYHYRDDGKVAYLTSNQGLPSREFEVDQSSVLSASGPIPPLWLYVGKEGTGNVPIPRELGHDAWLVEGLSQIIGGGTSQAAQFLLENKKKIDSIRRSFETSDPKYLGGGADGAAFDIGGGKVLKVFRDKVSYTKALLAFDRLHKSPSLAKTEAMIYDIGILGHYSRYQDEPGQDVYYYIMEKMKPIRDYYDDWYSVPVSKILSAIAEHISSTKNSKLRALKKAISDPTKEEAIRAAVKEESRQLAASLLQKPEIKQAVQNVTQKITALKPNWLELYIEEVIMKYLTGRTDLHMGNLGVTTYGELRYYDPAYGSHESEINI